MLWFFENLFLKFLPIENLKKKKNVNKTKRKQTIFPGPGGGIWSVLLGSQGKTDLIHPNIKFTHELEKNESLF